MAEVCGRDRGRNVWAAHPANNPRASSVRNDLPIHVAGGTPRRPNPAIVSGCFGTCRIGREQRRRQRRPATRGPSDVPIPCRAVHPEPGDGGVEGTMEQPRPPVIERVGEGHLGVDELETMSLEAGRLEERRHRGQGVDGRAHVVLEPGERQLGGAGAPADGVGGLEHEHGAAGLRRT